METTMPKVEVNRGMERRAFLKTAIGTVSLAAFGADATAQAANTSGSRVPEVCDYLESLRRPDGGYAWADQPQSHLTPSFAAVGCYHLLGLEPPKKESLDRIPADSSSVPHQEARTRPEGLRVPADSKPALARTGCRLVPRADRQVDKARRVPGRLREAQATPSSRWK